MLEIGSVSRLPLSSDLLFSARTMHRRDSLLPIVCSVISAIISYFLLTSYKYHWIFYDIQEDTIDGSFILEESIEMQEEEEEESEAENITLKVAFEIISQTKIFQISIIIHYTLIITNSHFFNQQNTVLCQFLYYNKSWTMPTVQTMLKNMPSH